MEKFSLSGTQLKIIAMITMVIDHVGLVLMDDFIPFRIIGRLSFPLFALLIAEGCFYTRNKKKYAGIIFGLGVLYQIPVYVSERSLHMCSLITFTMSILVIYAIDYARRHFMKRYAVLLPVALIVIFGLLTIWTPTLVPEETELYYMFDYGFCGMMLPVAAYYYRDDKKKQLLAMGAVLLMLGAIYGWVQLFGLLALVLICFYNGKRGRLAGHPVMKYAAYAFYPVHYVIIYSISMWMSIR